MICGGEHFPKIGVKIAVLSVFEKLLRLELHCPGRGCLKHLFFSLAVLLVNIQEMGIGVLIIAMGCAAKEAGPPCPKLGRKNI